MISLYAFDNSFENGTIEQMFSPCELPTKYIDLARDLKYQRERAGSKLKCWCRKFTVILLCSVKASFSLHCHIIGAKEEMKNNEDGFKIKCREHLGFERCEEYLNIYGVDPRNTGNSGLEFFVFTSCFLIVVIAAAFFYTMYESRDQWCTPMMDIMALSSKEEVLSTELKTYKAMQLAIGRPCPDIGPMLGQIILRDLDENLNL
jgi:hypothetical protein